MRGRCPSRQTTSTSTPASSMVDVWQLSSKAATCYVHALVGTLGRACGRVVMRHAARAGQTQSAGCRRSRPWMSGVPPTDQRDDGAWAVPRVLPIRAALLWALGTGHWAQDTRRPVRVGSCLGVAPAAGRPGQPGLAKLGPSAENAGSLVLLQTWAPTRRTQLSPCAFVSSRRPLKRLREQLRPVVQSVARARSTTCHRGRNLHQASVLGLQP